MNVHTIELDLHLRDDQVLDLFLLQWHTPSPIRASAFQPIAQDVVKQKQADFRHLKQWLIGSYDKGETPRPVFVVIPEYSLPLALVPEIEALAEAMSRPTVIIAGIEALTPDRYRELHRKAEDPDYTCPPDASPLRINAAIVVVRDEGGQIRRWTQMKRLLAPQEEGRVHCGNHVLLFHSRNDGSNAGLAFCVQICSDFTNPKSVAGLRTDLATADIRHPLDLLFLLQWQLNPSDAQFPQSYQAFLRQGASGLDTTGLAIVAVNSAWDGKSKDRFGDSRFVFPRRVLPDKSAAVAPFTYWLWDDNAHQVTSAVVRKPEPGVYWFRYKPIRLVPGTPGTNQVQLFPESARFISGEDLVDLVAGRSEFLQIEGEIVWWASEVRSSCDGVRDRISRGWQGNGALEDMCEHCWTDYSESFGRWLEHMTQHPGQSRPLIESVFRPQAQEPGYPAREKEPTRWDRDVARDARELVTTHALLVDAFSFGKGLPTLDLAFDGQNHASFGEGKALYVVCRGATDKRVIAGFLGDRECRARIDALAGGLLLALVGCAVQLSDKSQRRKWIDTKAGTVTRVDDVPLRGDHLDLSGGVTHTRGSIDAIATETLMEAVYEASDVADKHERLSRMLREELS